MFAQIKRSKGIVVVRVKSPGDRKSRLVAQYGRSHPNALETARQYVARKRLQLVDRWPTAA